VEGNDIINCIRNSGAKDRFLLCMMTASITCISSVLEYHFESEASVRVLPEEA